ncbi:MAG: TonB-dependent receptor [Desulfobacterales bacterium]|nr:TonB-dependent receptor [Desulfobacterales bacterium]
MTPPVLCASGKLRLVRILREGSDALRPAWALVRAHARPAPALAGQAAAEDQKPKTEKEKPVRITEEIQVVGKAPKDIPLATVTTVAATDIAKLKPRDLADVVKYVPGALVTFGDKDTYSLKLRGIGSNRIALLVDGVPVYEPYFSTFDLKTVSAGGIDTLQVTKGPSSVLYGPNTLGGLVNVITRRPSERPTLSLTGSYGDKATAGVGADGSVQPGSASRSRPAPSISPPTVSIIPTPRPAGPCGPTATSSGSTSAASSTTRPRTGPRSWSAPGPTSPPTACPRPSFTQRARYWRFPKWDRSNLSAGGFTSLGGDAVLRFRGFYVNYDNTLDWFTDPAMTDLDSSSTYDNSSYGGFALAEVPVGDRNTLKASLLYQKDIARTQDDTGPALGALRPGDGLGRHRGRAPADRPVEGHRRPEPRLHRQVPGRRQQHLAQSPRSALKFTPTEDLDFHVSFARKSRFPSMRSLYSTSSGNPDLLAESGTSLEFAATWSGPVYLTGQRSSSTASSDFIDTVQLLEGGIAAVLQRRPGPHLRLRGPGPEEAARWLAATVNYTFLDPWNDTDDRPLDAQPKQQPQLRRVRPAGQGPRGPDSTA